MGAALSWELVLTGLVVRRAALALCMLAATTATAVAKLPRGAILSANEQTGDETSGSTIARGNAEIAIPDFQISGRADVIELWPKRNQILLKGRAIVNVGAERFESDTVVCTLDFDRCAAEPFPAENGMEFSGLNDTNDARPDQAKPVLPEGRDIELPAPTAAATTP